MKKYRPKSRDEITRNMSAIRSTDNRTEKALRTAIHALGLRYRRAPAKVLGKPDVTFSREKIAIFVDGDYWHGRLLIDQGKLALEDHFKPAQRTYWVEKIQRNVERDRRVTNALQADGWLVLRFWESEIARRIQETALYVFEHVVRRRELLHRGSEIGFAGRASPLKRSYSVAAANPSHTRTVPQPHVDG